MAVTLSLFAGAGAQFLDNNGVMLSGGLVYTYAAGTTTPLAAYTSNTGDTALANPIVLDASGRVPTGQIWLTYGQGYKFTVKTSTGVLIGTYDNIPSAALPPLVNDAASIAYEQGASVTAGNFIIGQTYLITFIGSTNFQSIGAVSNTVGIYFTATGVGSGTGTAEISRTVEAKLQESVSVKDFGAIGNGVADDTLAIQSALTYIDSIGGGKLFVPTGTYKLTSAVNIYENTTLEGTGDRSSTFSFNHTGDGINSTFPINSSTSANISVNNLNIINTNGSNNGGGFVDVGGTYVDLYNCHFSGWEYAIILDQTQIATVDLCHILHAAATGIWLVNGADHTPGADKNYTNRITITRNQFNSDASGIASIIDDGGTAHVISNNNFNGGITGIRAAGFSALTISGNESEVHISEDIYLADTTKAGGYVGGGVAFNINANTLLSSSGGRNIAVQAGNNGAIEYNMFGQAVAAINFINGASNPSSGIVIKGNSKLITGTFRSSGIFISGFSRSIAQNLIDQVACTYSSSSASAGVVTITPATMEYITPNTKLTLSNDDGTNKEDVVVTSTTASTFTCTLTSIKTANFLIYGATPGSQIQGTWTPTLYGSTTAGTNTYSTQTGTYYKVGGIVTVNAQIVISAKDAAMAGGIFVGNLPFIPNTSGFIGNVFYSGLTFAAGYTQVNCNTTANTNGISLLREGSAVALTPVVSTDIPGATCSISITVQYTTNS